MVLGHSSLAYLRPRRLPGATRMDRPPRWAHARRGIHVSPVPPGARVDSRAKGGRRSGQLWSWAVPRMHHRMWWASPGKVRGATHPACFRRVHASLALPASEWSDAPRALPDGEGPGDADRSGLAPPITGCGTTPEGSEAPARPCSGWTGAPNTAREWSTPFVSVRTRGPARSCPSSCARPGTSSGARLAPVAGAQLTHSRLGVDKRPHGTIPAVPRGPHGLVFPPRAGCSTAWRCYSARKGSRCGPA